MGIQAVIKGKISSSGSNLTEKLEDLMTSNLFQNILYLPFEKGLKPILSQAFNKDKKKLILNSDFTILNYEFWPQWKNCEPDLVISLNNTQTQKQLNILLEAKLYSLLSGENQLVREWKDLISFFPKGDNYLIYLNAEPYFPKTEFLKSKKIDKTINTTRFYWLTYEAIYAGLVKNNVSDNPIIQDIIHLLEYYYFVPFDKWSSYSQVQSVYNLIMKDSFLFNTYKRFNEKYNQQWTIIK